MNETIIAQQLASVLAAGQGQAISMMGVTIVTKVAPEDTNNAWALFEYTMPPRFRGPEPHTHARTTELFYVLEGSVGFLVGDETIVATRGASVFVPPGAVHTFSNPSDEPAAFLSVCSPGDFAGYFKELLALIEAEGRWPLADMSRLAPLWERYDIVPAPRA